MYRQIRCVSPRLAKYLVAVALFASASCVAQAPGADAPFGVVLFEEGLMIEARDGTRLATDIYRPTEGGVVLETSLPVLLQRTPYDRTNRGLVEQARFLASHGYVVAVQDTRGRYASEGVFVKYYDYDAYDGYDVIEYLAALPYTEPVVGMWGTSYGAHTQADPSKLNPPSMGPLVLNQGGMSNAWDHSVRLDGTFEVGRQVTWAWGQLRNDAPDDVVRERLDQEDVWDWMMNRLPLRKGLNPLSIAPNFEDYVLNMAIRADYDDYWKALGHNWEEYYDQTADVPMLHVGGWYDIYARGTVDNYLGLSALKDSPIRLLIGPWTHGGNNRSYAGDVEFGPEAAFEDFYSGFHLRWFDHFIKGQANGVESEAPVRLFVMGTGDGSMTSEGRLFHGGYWRDAETWPLPETEYLRLYFHPDGSLQRTPPGPDGGSTSYTHDPANPIPTIGGGVSGRLRDGGYDQREHPNFPPSAAPYLPLGARLDNVVFQTDVLSEDLEVVGPITVVLHATSSAVDTDFTAKLIDSYPPSADYPSGFDLNITDGVIRARYRATRERAELIEPGRSYEYTIRPFPTANVFKAGHRIRVDIASSNFPRVDVNHGTGEPLGMERRWVKADNTIHHDSRLPSHIVLPVVNRGATR